jgi:hypothetical protein
MNTAYEDVDYNGGYNFEGWESFLEDDSSIDDVNNMDGSSDEVALGWPPKLLVQSEEQQSRHHKKQRRATRRASRSLAYRGESRDEGDDVGHGGDEVELVGEHLRGPRHAQELGPREGLGGAWWALGGAWGGGFKRGLQFFWGARRGRQCVQ